MIKVQNPEFESRIKKFLENQHFMKFVGFELDVIEPGGTEGWMEIDQNHLQQTGLIHGGLITTIADIVAGFAAYSVVPATHHVVTGEIKVSFFKPGRGSRLFAIGWVVNQGRKINFCEAEVYSENNGKKELIAKATTSMVVIPPKE
jgi:uncharacterized protein (TIGR00369 family)